ncbi:MAG TPA: HEAT repeat domain-containing protein [Planctomycetota bacterium]
MAFAAALSIPLSAAQSDDFQAAVEALQRGANQEALELLQKVVGADLSNEDAFELWVRTENRVWLQLLTQGGELELVARELVEKARLGRKQRQNNPEAIRALVKELANDNVIARNKVVNQLAADYGEYAVPILIYSLAESGPESLRVNAIAALTRMGTDVVLPLIETMESPDTILRRNVALTLGYIKDERAKPVLSRAAASDPDTGVRGAASQALGRMGGPGDAGALYFALGEAYYREDDSVLAPHQYSDVLWRWEGNGLVATEVPRFLYAPELAKKNYYRALALQADGGPALAGIARCAVTEIGRLDEWLAAGQEAAGWDERLQSDELAAQVAGPEALDLALGWAISKNDFVAASGLCRLLASSGKVATANLKAALGASRSGAVQGEAAVALGRIAYRNREAAGADAVSALGTAAAREVLRIGAIIGGSEAEGRRLATQLEEQGYHVSWWPTGSRGLVSMRSLPGVDLVIIDDQLPDLLPRQVVSELRSEPRLARTRVFIKASTADTDAAAYGDKINGILAPGDDLASATEAAAGEPLNRDREEALQLAVRAAETLQLLAAGGKTDVAPVMDALAGTLANRPDDVVAPALGLLQFVGEAAHVERVAGVLTDAERPEAVRAGAARALASIFSRTGTADAALIQKLQEIAQQDGSFAVRAATAGALGRLNLTKDARVELMRGLLTR